MIDCELTDFYWLIDYAKYWWLSIDNWLIDFLIYCLNEWLIDFFSSSRWVQCDLRRGYRTCYTKHNHCKLFFLKPFLNCFWTVFNCFCKVFDLILDRFSIVFCNVFYLFLDRFQLFLWSFWLNFGPFWLDLDRFWIVFGPFLTCFWTVFDYFLHIFSVRVKILHSNKNANV